MITQERIVHYLLADGWKALRLLILISQPTSRYGREISEIAKRCRLTNDEFVRILEHLQTYGLCCISQGRFVQISSTGASLLQTIRG